MTMKKRTSETSVPKTPKAFNYRPDETRSKQLADLIRKTGVKQQGIVSIAISKLWESEFPSGQTMPK